MDMQHLDPLFLAWLAGFVDGEGCIHVLRDSRKRQTGNLLSYRPVVFVANCGQDVLTDITLTLGCGAVYELHRATVTDPRRQSYQLHFAGVEAIQICRLLLPYLRVKQKQAALLLTYPIPDRRYRGNRAPLPDSIRNQRESIYQELLLLNAKGTRGDALRHSS